MAYVRWPCEVEYVYLLHDLLRSGIVEKHGGAHGELLVYRGALVTPDRRDLAYRTADARRDPSRGVSAITGLTTLDFREFERQMRHKTEKLIPGHCREARVLRPGVLPSMFVAAHWWWELVEVVWSMRAELPRSLAYISRMLLGNARHPAWNIVRTEWAVEVCRDLIYQARDRRLFWIPVAVREDIQKVGVEHAFKSSGARVVQDLSVLLDYIDCLRWSRCPPENRYSFPDQTKSSPMFLSGDFFEFDPVEWRVLVDDDMFIRRGENGELLEPMDDHGETFTGVTAGRFVAQTNRTGFSRGEGANYSGKRGGKKPSRGLGKSRGGGRGHGRARGRGKLAIVGPSVRETRELIPRVEDGDEDVVMDEAEDGDKSPASGVVFGPVLPPGFHQGQLVSHLRELMLRASASDKSPAPVSTTVTGLRSVPLQSPARPSLTGSEQAHAKETVATAQVVGSSSKSTVTSSLVCETIDLTGDSTDDEPIYGSRPNPIVTLEVKREVALEKAGGDEEARAPDGDRLTEDKENYEEESD